MARGAADADSPDSAPGVDHGVDHGVDQRAAHDVDADLDTAPPTSHPPHRRASTGQRRRRSLAAAAVAALAVTVGFVVQAQQDDGPAPLDGTASAEELFPVLAEPARPGDALPDAGLAADVGIADGSERLLAVAPAASFWVARGSADSVCLVVRATDDELGRGGICTSAADAVRGVALPAGGGPSAVLLPAGADTAVAREAGDAELVPGLWVDEDTADGVVVAAVEGASTRLTVVQAQALRGSGRLPVLDTIDGAPYAVVLSCLRAAEIRVAVSEVGDPEPCPDDVLVRRFTGDGSAIQVGLTAPESLVWAAEVVSCTGPASAPTC